MKNEINKKENQNEKKDNTFIFAAAVFGLIMLAAISIVLKVLGVF